MEAFGGTTSISSCIERTFSLIEKSTGGYHRRPTLMKALDIGLRGLVLIVNSNVTTNMVLRLKNLAWSGSCFNAYITAMKTNANT
jgi:hypothetical protein